MADVDIVGARLDQSTVFGRLDRMRLGERCQQFSVYGLSHRDQIDDVAHVVGFGADLLFNQFDQ